MSAAAGLRGCQSVELSVWWCEAVECGGVEEDGWRDHGSGKLWNGLELKRVVTGAGCAVTSDRALRDRPADGTVGRPASW